MVSLSRISRRGLNTIGEGKMFGRERIVITKHINSVFREGEVVEKSNVQNMHICYSMLMLFFSVLCASASLALDTTLPTGLSYEVRKNENHVIHILTIEPTQYELKLVKAHNQVFGRETVPEIALRSNAIAALNAGFVEIGHSEDGRPSGT